MLSKLVMALMLGTGAILFFSARTAGTKIEPDGPVPATSSASAPTTDELRESRKRYCEKALALLDGQKRKSAADRKKAYELRKELNSLY